MEQAQLCLAIRLMTFVAEKRAGWWVVITAQNTNAGPARPEAQDITSPISVPRSP